MEHEFNEEAERAMAELFLAGTHADAIQHVRMAFIEGWIIRAKIAVDAERGLVNTIKKMREDRDQ